jgi:hypothetical protein
MTSLVATNVVREGVEPLDRVPARTLLEKIVREGDHTIDEWCVLFDSTARGMTETATLSARQLQRWMAGQVDNARPAARRVAGQLWGHPFNVLLMVPETPTSRAEHDGDSGREVAEVPGFVPETGATEPVCLVMSGPLLSQALIDVVRTADECLVAVGSRSREPGYLQEIEEMLRRRPDTVHYRILIGPPHSQVLKDHLRRLLEQRGIELRPPLRKNLYMSILEDTTSDHERFFVASERAAVVLLPSANSPANFDTGLIVRTPDYVRGLVAHGKALYGRRRLETLEAVDELAVLH